MAVTEIRLFELAEELADTPTLSVFVRTSTACIRSGTSDVWRTEVASLTQSIRCRLLDVVTRGEREMFERNLRRLELRLRGLPHVASAAGWFVVVARGDVHYCAPVDFAGPSDGRWQPGPWLAPVWNNAICSHVASMSYANDHGS
jgi:hypothetical protein